MSIDTYIQQRNESNRKARAFLREVLAGGPQTYQIVHEQAVKQGISKSYLLTARRSLHVESHKSDGYAVWNLPAAASSPLTPLASQLGDSRFPRI